MGKCPAVIVKNRRVRSFVDQTTRKHPSLDELGRNGKFVMDDVTLIFGFTAAVTR